MNASNDGHPLNADRLTAEEKIRSVARYVLQCTETERYANGAGRGRTDAQDVGALAEAAQQLAECVIAYFSKGQGPGPVLETPPSFREIERYGLELRARAHQRYPHPTPEQREKIEAKIARLVKAFSEKGSSPENPQTGESSLAAESLPQSAPAAASPRPRPLVASPPARVWDGPGLFPAP